MLNSRKRPVVALWSNSVRARGTLNTLNFKKKNEFKKYILHVKLTVWNTVSFTRNIHFLKSAYFIFNLFKSNKLFSVSFAVGYIS